MATKKKIARKKTARKKTAKTYIKNRQTKGQGKNSVKKDKKRKALPPGKRRSASGKTYYEYRKDHTDLRGSLTGAESGISKKAMNLILDNIDASGYNEKPVTDTAKIEFLQRVFNSEYGWAVKRYGKQKAIQEWLQGLPSVLTLPFYNNEIIALAKKWGSLPANATEKQEDRILNNYWKLMASNVLKLFNKIGSKVTGTHKDTKSHNVNIRVVSGIEKLSNRDQQFLEIQRKFTRINNDVNGNPRYVIHFPELLTDEENRFLPFGKQYEYALKKAKKIGGRKFHNRQYGGGIVFQSYSIIDTWNAIQRIKNDPGKIKM